MLAHDAFPFSEGLCLLFARRKPERIGATIYKFIGNNADRRAVAWRFVEFCLLGRTSWDSADAEPFLAKSGGKAEVFDAPHRRARSYVARCDLCLGAVPRADAVSLVFDLAGYVGGGRAKRDPRHIALELDPGDWSLGRRVVFTEHCTNVLGAG